MDLTGENSATTSVSEKGNKFDVSRAWFVGHVEMEFVEDELQSN